MTCMIPVNKAQGVVPADPAARSGQAKEFRFSVVGKNGSKAREGRGRHRRLIFAGLLPTRMTNALATDAVSVVA